jgi:hypothetical protein
VRPGKPVEASDAAPRCRVSTSPPNGTAVAAADPVVRVFASSPSRRPRRFTLASDPDHPSAFVTCPPDRHGSFARSRLLRVAFRYPFDLARPGRATQVFPRPPPDGAPGVRSLRRFSPADGWTRHAALPWRSIALPGQQVCLLRAGDSRSSSAFLPVRAHVSFVPPHPPRLIFVGVTDRLLENLAICKSDRPGMGWRRLLGFDSRLRSACPAPCGRTRDPALGFASCRVAGTFRRASARARPRFRSSIPGRATRATHSPAAIPIRSWVSRRGCSTETSAALPADRIVIAKALWAFAVARRPFSVLMGLMPCRSERITETRPGRLPV